jgi:hypothetical protein
MPFLAWLVDGPSRTRIGYNPAAANMIRSYLSSLYYDMKLFFGEILICLLMITSSRLDFDLFVNDCQKQQFLL